MRTLKNCLFATSAAATMIATPALAKDHSRENLGRGDFQVYIFHPEKLAALYPEKAHDIKPVTTRDIDAMNIIGDDCVAQAKLQTPSVVKTVVVVAARNLPGAIAGGYLGAKVGGLTPKGSVVTAAGYAKYNGAATVGGSVGAGINDWEMGKHNSVAGCMAGIVPKAQKDGYVNTNIVVTYNTFPVYGPTLKRSQFPEPTSDDSAGQPARANGDSDADGATPVPPHGS